MTFLRLKLYFISILCLFLMLSESWAQDFRYNLFGYNSFGSNPAWAATKSEFNLTFHSRKQFVTAGLSHKTLMLSALYPLKHTENYTSMIGISFFDDRQNYFGRVQGFDLLGAFAVKISPKKPIFAALGIQAGSREIDDELRGADYFIAWSGGALLYQNEESNPYRKKWFLGLSSYNWLQNERYLENYQFNKKMRTIILAGFELWHNQKFAFIPNIRSILHADLHFTNYGASLRRYFSDNAGTLFRYGSWGISAWYAPKQAINLAIDLDSPTINLGLSYGFSQNQHLFSYKNANEFIISLKKPLYQKKKDEKPIINEEEPVLE
ncbi:MAG: type IX secretion system membrane protein PorP/SprF [Thermonemataceae bacterium]|nr:type IX secretion system membrane protein PorP/SprF [Thermonemataceae bacterium]